MKDGSGKKSYSIYRRQQGTTWTEIANQDQNTLSFRDSNVTCHIIYEYRVMARDEATGLLSFSNTDSDTAFELRQPLPPLLSRISVTEAKCILILVCNFCPGSTLLPSVN